MTLSDSIRVLTVLEPWASLIASGRKTWENRGPRDGKFAGGLRGEWLAIHAGGLHPVDPRASVPRVANTGIASVDHPAPDGDDWPCHTRTGNIVALAKIGRVLQPGFGDSPWRIVSEWGIELLDIHRLDPLIPCQGVQGWRYLKRIDGAGPFYKLAEQVGGWPA